MATILKACRPALEPIPRQIRDAAGKVKDP